MDGDSAYWISTPMKQKLWVTAEKHVEHSEQNLTWPSENTTGSQQNSVYQQAGGTGPSHPHQRGSMLLICLWCLKESPEKPRACTQESLLQPDPLVMGQLVLISS